MPKSVMPLGAKNAKVCKEKKQESSSVS